MQVSFTTFTCAIALVFSAISISKIIVNPASIDEEPTTANAEDKVDEFSTRSIAVFSLVLVVIQFTLQSDSLNYWDMMAVNALTISASILMLGFILELWSISITFAFNLQVTSLRYAGLLLFSGFYFLLRSKDIPGIIVTIFVIFLVVVWVIWILHEIKYIFKIQRTEWNSRDMTRIEWGLKKIGK